MTPEQSKSVSSIPHFNGLTTRFPGLLLSAGIATAALGLSQFALFSTLGPLTLAMLLGLLLGQRVSADLRHRTGPGTAVAKTQLLRLGIILYGLRIGFDDLLHVGTPALLTDAIVVLGVFSLAGWVGTRFLKMEARTALLVGAGSAVCGAAAVLAMAPALRARERDIPVAIATVVLFGTVSMLLYPWLWTLAPVQQLFGGSDLAFGRYLGSTIHEVAQVAAAAGALDPAAGQAAVITKLIRVILLVPLIFLVSAWFARRENSNETDKVKMPVPWFALLFLLMPLVNASGVLDAQALGLIGQLDSFLLAMAMAALGVETQLATLRYSGAKPMLLGAVLFVVLVFGGPVVALLAGTLG
ncbi:putative sulfate exporter family transporter [Granulosicoccaceae sp. 1_MG-2023]|nr:putative sulfate exporter family transporter [Granulosicoccaceae sp. 1_MG-2023]